ncbi:MAG: LamG-like jellyroll fold domain-containing protein [Microgenomates group bacterium]
MDMVGIKAALPSWTFSQNFGTHSITVTTTAELTAAMQLIARQGGGTILLDGNGGPYSISAKDYGSALAPVVLAPLDPANPPHVKSVAFNNVSHVAITGMDVNPGVANNVGDIMISNSDHIALIDNTMTGTANGFLSETGTATKGDNCALIRNSQQISIIDNTISNYNHGMAFLEIKGLEFSGNDVSQLQGDGFRGGGLQNIDISGNHFHDFYGSTQTLNHSDMIQIWGTHAVTLTQNVSITGNILDAGSGAATQTIFIRNDAFGAGTSAVNGYFKNITVSDNVISNGTYHGIMVSDTNGVNVTSNTVLWNQHAMTHTTPTSGANSAAPKISVNNSLGVTIVDNLASSISTSAANQVVAGTNYLLNYTNPDSANYYQKHVLNLTALGDGDIRDLMLRPDSPIWGNFGSSLSSGATSTSGVQAVLCQEKVDGDALALDFSAAFCIGKTGLIDPATAKAVWTFSDGTTTTGWDVRHSFTKPGDYAVTLKLVNNLGQTDSITRAIHVDDPTLFSFNFDAGLKDGSLNHMNTVLKGSTLASAGTGLAGKGFHLTSATALTVDKANLQLFNLDAFDINLDFRKDSATGTGGLLNLQNTMDAKVLSGGAIQFVLKTTAGNFSVTTAPGVLADQKWHDISFRYDGDSIDIVVDGKVCGSSPASGTTAPQAAWGLVLGSPWSPPVNGMVDNFSMKVPSGLSLVHSSPIETQPITGAPDMGTAPHTGTALAPIVKTDIDFSGKAADGSNFATKVTIKDPLGNSFVAGREGEGFHLNGTNSVTLDRSNSHLYGLDNFDISLALRKDAATGAGGLLNLHKTLDLEVLANNALQFKLQTDAGSFVIKTAANVLSDTAWHDIKLHFDSDAKVMSILVDGKVAATGVASGTTADAASWGLVIGDPWHAAVKGVVDDFHFSVAPEPVAPQQTIYEAFLAYHADAPAV